MIPTTLLIGLGILVFFIVAFAVAFASWYNKVPQGEAIVRTGSGGLHVAFDRGMFIIPVLHRREIMDISLKKIEISRMGKDGLICQDNMRADIKVAFFIRVNREVEDVKKVALTIGCERASDPETLSELFEAKFSEALKTVGKRFDFVELYDSREKLKTEIMNVIGTDLNGYIMDDAAIDYLEQTPIEFLKDDNILDSEGIKKITELTAEQHMKANLIRREEEKVIKKQDVEAREAILELEKQLAEKEEKQQREIETIRAREQAETKKVQVEERLRYESARITTEEELAIQEENKQRQIIVAAKNKERTDAVETERVEKDRALEATERERVVTLADIEKEKAVEEERKNIQDVIKERVAVQKLVVEEEELMKDLQADKTAERDKRVAIIAAEKSAEELLVQRVKEAEANKKAAELSAQQKIIEAEAAKEASSKESDARKIIAEAKAAEEATIGKAEAQVIEAKAHATEVHGKAEARVIEEKAYAEAKGIEAKATAEKSQGIMQAEVIKEQGSSEAIVIEQKAVAEATGIKEKGIAEAAGVKEKAIAMKELDGVGKEHEEFKLKLEKEKQVELAEIGIQKDIAEAQAQVVGEALKSSNIDIVGGETMFYENILQQVGRGKAIDRLMGNSKNLTDLKNAFIGDGDGNFNTDIITKVKEMILETGIGSEDIKNLSISALIMKLYSMTDNGDKREFLTKVMETISQYGLGDKKADDLYS